MAEDFGDILENAVCAFSLWRNWDAVSEFAQPVCSIMEVASCFLHEVLLPARELLVEFVPERRPVRQLPVEPMHVRRVRLPPRRLPLFRRDLLQHEFSGGHCLRRGVSSVAIGPSSTGFLGGSTPGHCNRRRAYKDRKVQEYRDCHAEE